MHSWDVAAFYGLLEIFLDTISFNDPLDYQTVCGLVRGDYTLL